MDPTPDRNADEQPLIYSWLLAFSFNCNTIYQNGGNHMALKLRLTRMGSKKRPFYRIVALDSATRRDGRPLEYIGYYNPMVEPVELKIDAEKVKMWMERGAKPSNTVRSLLKKAESASE